MEYEIRAVVHFLYLNQTSVPSALAQLVSTYGEGCISRSGVRYWYKEFKNGRTDLADLHRSGRPVENERVEEIQQILEEFPFASARYISATLAISKGKVIRILKQELGLKKCTARWVPHFLNEDQKRKRVEYSISMLKKLTSLNENQRASVVTGDESWIFLINQQESAWCAPGENPPDLEKKMINSEKVMIFVSFNCKGIISINALPTNTRFTSTYMCESILPEMTENANVEIAKYTKHHKLLHIDNARPHTAKATLAKIKALGWEKLEHPPYSPDISPCDFFLFGYLKNELKKWQTKTVGDLINAIKEICLNIKQITWENVFESWINRLNAVIECNGEYPHFY